MLRVFRQLHESVIHVQLDVTVKQRQTGINPPVILGISGSILP